MPCQVRLSSAAGAGELVVPACAALPAASSAPARRLPPRRESPRCPPSLLGFIAAAMIGLKFLTLNSSGFLIRLVGCIRATSQDSFALDPFRADRNLAFCASLRIVAHSAPFS